MQRACRSNYSLKKQRNELGSVILTILPSFLSQITSFFLFGYRLLSLLFVQIIQKLKSRYTNHVGIPLAAYVSLNNSDILVAKLCFAAGETPCFPTIDSNTASDNCLFLITTLPFSGNKQSFEKPICGQKRKKEPTKRIQIHSWFQFNFPCTQKQIYTCKYTCISTSIIPKFALLYMINNKEQQMQQLNDESAINFVFVDGIIEQGLKQQLQLLGTNQINGYLDWVFEHKP